MPTFSLVLSFASLVLLKDSDLATPSDQGWQDSGRLGDSASKPLPDCPPLCLLPSPLPAALPAGFHSPALLAEGDGWFTNRSGMKF